MSRISTSNKVVNSRGLVSAFGSALHGFHRGPQAFFPEPLDIWLATLMDAVPFYQNSLIVCPSRMTHTRASLLLKRAREHIPAAHLAPLRRRDSTNSLNSNKTEVSSRANGKNKNSIITTRTGGSLPLFVSPLENFSPNSLDLVIFAGNVFGEEMLYDAPWHLSLAHRCLRPHGVIAIIGYSTRIRIVAPEIAKRDADDFLEDLQLTANKASEEKELGELCELYKKAMNISNSLDIGHADMYFPFPSKRRRWFVSEYAATPAQIAATYRTLPEYQLLSKGIYRSTSLLLKDKEEMMTEDDEAVNVLRRRTNVDPLEALQGCLQAIEKPREDGKFSSPSLRIQVKHFIITCSSRSVNSSTDSHQFPSQGGESPRLR